MGFALLHGCKPSIYRELSVHTQSIAKIFYRNSNSSQRQFIAGVSICIDVKLGLIKSSSNN